MGVQHGPELLEREAMTWRLFLAQIAGAFLIIGVAYGFLAATDVHAATVCRGKLVEASWYGRESCVNKRDCRTYDGTRYDGSQLLVAHRTWPMGTMVRVTYKGKSVVVPVRDRGPAAFTGRDIDLSRAVAAKIGFLAQGASKRHHPDVCIERVG